MKEGNIQDFITSQNILDTSLASVIPEWVTQNHKVVDFIFSSHLLKSSNPISFCLGLRDNQYSSNDQIALKNLQSDVTEKKSDFTEVMCF